MRAQRFILLKSVLLTLTLFLSVPQAVANVCDDIVLGASLENFDPHTVKFDEFLSPRFLVIKLDGPNGHQYVARLNANSQNLEHEQFATAFINQVPGKKTPRVQLLSRKPSEKLWLQIKKYLQYFEKKKIDEARKGMAEIRFSIAPYLPFERGNFVLKRLQAWNRTRRVLFDFPVPDSDRSIQTIDREWRMLDEESHVALVGDLKKIFPETASITAQEYKDYFINNIDRIDTSKLYDLALIARDHVPESIRQQLADYWALYTVLGIADFHPRNWLLRDGQEVIAIDLAYPTTLHSPQVIKGSLGIRFQQHPYGSGFIIKPIQQAMLKDISPQLIQYFESLTPQTVKALAEQVGYELTDPWLNALMTRVRAVLKHTKQNSRAQ